MKHTPGPWKADLRIGCFTIYPANEEHNCLSGSDQWAIVYQHGRGFEPDANHYPHVLTDEQIANAKLLAAAPDLLAALPDPERLRDIADRLWSATDIEELNGIDDELCAMADRAEEAAKKARGNG